MTDGDCNWIPSYHNRIGCHFTPEWSISITTSCTKLFSVNWYTKPHNLLSMSNYTKCTSLSRLSLKLLYKLVTEGCLKAVFLLLLPPLLLGDLQLCIYHVLISTEMPHSWANHVAHHTHNPQATQDFHHISTIVCCIFLADSWFTFIIITSSIAIILKMENYCTPTTVIANIFIYIFIFLLC